MGLPKYGVAYSAGMLWGTCLLECLSLRVVQRHTSLRQDRLRHLTTVGACVMDHLRGGVRGFVSGLALMGGTDGQGPFLASLSSDRMVCAAASAASTVASS